MRLSVRLASALCVLTLVAPFAADAAVAAKTLRLRDIVKIVEQNKKPLSFNGTLKTSDGKNKATIAIEGSHNGTIEKLEDAAMDIGMTIDATLEDRSTIHGTIDIRIVDETLYAKLDDVALTGSLAAYEAIVDPYLGVWIAMPADPSMYAEKPTRTPSVSRFEPYFSIAESSISGGSRYTITIPKEKQRRLLALIMRSTSGYSQSYNATMRKHIRSTTLDATITVDVVRGIFDAMTNSISVTTTQGGTKGSFTFTGSTKALSSAPSITAPNDSMTLEELMSEQGF